MLTLKLHDVPNYVDISAIGSRYGHRARAKGDRDPDPQTAIGDWPARIERRGSGISQLHCGRSPDAAERRSDLSRALLFVPWRGRQGCACRRSRRSALARRHRSRVLHAWSAIATTSSKCCLTGSPAPSMASNLNGGAVMVSMAGNTDEWIADVANFVRNAFGNSGRPLITPAQVAAVRQASARRTPWTMAELQATLPTAAHEHRRVEADRQPQSRGGRRVHAAVGTAIAVGHRRPAGARHVVPDRIAAADARRRTAARRDGTHRPRDGWPRRFWWPWRSASTCGGRCGRSRSGEAPEARAALAVAAVVDEADRQHQ